MLYLQSPPNHFQIQQLKFDIQWQGTAREHFVITFFFLCLVKKMCSDHPLSQWC